jgi:hypothetical protein
MFSILSRHASTGTIKRTDRVAKERKKEEEEEEGVVMYARRRRPLSACQNDSQWW